MEALHNAAQAASDQIASLERQLASLADESTKLRADLDFANGTIAELRSELTLEKQKSDHNLRWATQVTTQIHSIGMFCNEAMRIARKEIAENTGKPIPASRTNNEVLESMEKELAATVSELTPAIPEWLSSTPNRGRPAKRAEGEKG